MIKTRFAPSPTGYLHIGNVRTALVNYLFTRKNGGQFVLRMDDTDTARSKDEYAEQIKQDLTWLGMKWDDFKKQSERNERYNQVKESLLNIGRLYECFETPEELEIKRKMQLSRGKPPIYDRAALKLTKEEKDKFLSEGRKPHYRFKMFPNDIIWQDMVKGEIKFSGENLGDPIVIREDNSMTYILCSVIDDIDFAITHIIRGEDHVTNTAVQIQMFEAMGAKHPVFGHTALIKSKDQEISKRLGGFDIKSLKEKGVEPMAISSMFSKIGTSDPIEPFINMENLIQSFDITKFGKAPANYDESELTELNRKLVSLLGFNDVASRLAKANINCDKQFWDGIKGNLEKVDDIKQWWDICNNAIKPLIDDLAVLNAAKETFPAGEDWNLDTWQKWTKQIGEKTGLKGKALFMPLRKALTGLEHGPEIKYLLPVIGKDRGLKRLNGEVA